ncbi:MAG: hypothetical protein U1D97_01585, partial [Desulfuromonadales bacterium]|nr:hypothetical protein [Desulfuromonadales bacterium]
MHHALTASAAAGFSYLKLPDPHGGQKELREVVRSDGKRLQAHNVWLSKSRNRDQGSPDYLQWEHYLSVFDAGSTGSYTVVFGEPAGQPSTPVLQFIADRAVVEG